MRPWPRIESIEVEPAICSGLTAGHVEEPELTLGVGALPRDAAVVEAQFGVRRSGGWKEALMGKRRRSRQGEGDADHARVAAGPSGYRNFRSTSQSVGYLDDPAHFRQGLPRKEAARTNSELAASVAATILHRSQKYRASNATIHQGWVTPVHRE